MNEIDKICTGRRVPMSDELVDEILKLVAALVKVETELKATKEELFQERRRSWQLEVDLFEHQVRKNVGDILASRAR